MKKSYSAILICAFILTHLTGCTKQLRINEEDDKKVINLASNQSSILYTNTQYGFKFSLPESWKGYTIVNSTWEGLAIGDQNGEKVVETGSLIAIRHPQWMTQRPRQDIPIMIFTLNQWNSLQQEKFHIGAAPIGPSELGRNHSYVFALPARYNYSFPLGYEEVENIIKGSPLKTTKDKP